MFNIRAVESYVQILAEATNGKTKAALELIRHGADNTIVAVGCGTPLHQAAGCGHVTTV